MKTIQVAIAILLLLCLFSMPYGFYMFIRFISTIGFAFLTFHYYKMKKEKLAITFGIAALLFQPFFKVALGRDLWIIIDIIMAILLIILVTKEKRQSK